MLLPPFAGGALIGSVGGLVGLGGAEFRLPLLMTAFGFAALPAVVLNQAMSLVVVATALLARSAAVPIGELAAHALTIVNLLAGSLVGAWFAAGSAARWPARKLQRVIAVLLAPIGLALLFSHGVHGGEPPLQGAALIAAGVCAGLAIGAVASLLGVAGGELLIPTLVLLFGADIKLAGSLSLAISLPTLLVGLARYRRGGGLDVLRSHRGFAVAMAAGSVAGAALGGLWLGAVPAALLLPALAAILFASAWRLWRGA